MKNQIGIYRLVAVVLVGIISHACAPHQTAIIYGDNYDAKKNVTSITILPYGGVDVPGKWIKTSENKISHQHFFLGPDSTTFAVALNQWDKYEFYSNEITPDNFLQKFYEWESDYFKKQTNGQARIVKEDKAKHFIIWNLTRPPGLNEYFLFGLKGKVAYNLYLGSDHWDETKQIELLEKIYTQQ